MTTRRLPILLSLATAASFVVACSAAVEPATGQNESAIGKPGIDVHLESPTGAADSSHAFPFAPGAGHDVTPGALTDDGKPGGATPGDDGSKAPACPGVLPAAPTDLSSGNAVGAMMFGSKTTVSFAKAAIVPIPGTNYMQIVASDDPNLCATLEGTSQSDGCSLAPGMGKADTNGYTYVAVELPFPATEGAASTSIAVYKGGTPHVETVGWAGVFKVNEPMAASTSDVTAQFYVCEGKYPAAGSGQLHASLCAGRRICF